MPESYKVAEIKLERLVKKYGDQRVVNEVSLLVTRGEFVTLLGPSGSGKTTTLMMIAGFVEPDEGDVYIGGTRITEIPAHRRGIGMVFQHYALFPHMTIFDNVAYPLRMRRIPKKEIRKRVQSALELVQLPDVGARHPRQLSGGQQQRIAVARALVYEPDVLLMDEPLGALDRKLREQMQFELRTLQKSLGITTLYVTHDQQEAMSLSDRVVVMQEGRIEQIGPSDDLYENPRTHFVASFIGESNCLDGRLKKADESWAFITANGLSLPVAPQRDEPSPTQARFIIRPESIQWADFSLTEISTAAVIESATYLGERIRYSVSLADGTRLIVTHPNLKSIHRYKIGESVRIGWNRSDATIL